MNGIINSDATKKLLENTLKENAGAFAASVLDLYNTDTYLQKCDPKQVFGECLKAASLKLPINKQLGFAYV
ncbi:MAG: recombinase RecT, partial [Clostridia bacterium]|nr:recombinase RecT [Clostridia bacterium]